MRWPPSARTMVGWMREPQLDCGDPGTGVTCHTVRKVASGWRRPSPNGVSIAKGARSRPLLHSAPAYPLSQPLPSYIYVDEVCWAFHSPSGRRAVHPYPSRGHCSSTFVCDSARISQVVVRLSPRFLLIFIWTPTFHLLFLVAISIKPSGHFTTMMLYVFFFI